MGGLPGPFALDFDYRYSASKYSAIIINLLTLDQSLTWGVEMWTGDYIMLAIDDQLINESETLM